MQCKEKRQHAVCQNETHTASVLISNAALERVLISPLQPVTHNSDDACSYRPDRTKYFFLLSSLCTHSQMFTDTHHGNGCHSNFGLTGFDLFWIVFVIHTGSKVYMEN